MWKYWCEGYVAKHSLFFVYLHRNSKKLKNEKAILVFLCVFMFLGISAKRYYKSPDRLDELWATKEEVIDACVAMIELLHELKML
jgi:hypothetical protein